MSDLHKSKTAETPDTDPRDTSKDYRVRNDELRELVDQWRDQAKLQKQFGNDTLAEMSQQHADELEDLLDG